MSVAFSSVGLGLSPHASVGPRCYASVARPRCASVGRRRCASVGDGKVSRDEERRPPVGDTGRLGHQIASIAVSRGPVSGLL